MHKLLGLAPTAKTIGMVEVAAFGGNSSVSLWRRRKSANRQ
jgi:hypothetical protein